MMLASAGCTATVYQEVGSSPVQQQQRQQQEQQQQPQRQQPQQQQQPARQSQCQVQSQDAQHCLLSCRHVGRSVLGHPNVKTASTAKTVAQYQLLFMQNACAPPITGSGSSSSSSGSSRSSSASSRSSSAHQLSSSAGRFPQCAPRSP
jgi:hypothetical protein